MDTLLTAAHALAWCIYVGGGVCMEWVLRYAQDHMRPSQVAVVCQNAGQRYRWWSFVSLLVLAATGATLTDQHLFETNTTYRATCLALTFVWLVQLVLLALLSFFIHPAMHARVSTTMSEDEVRAERQRVGEAIRRMDIVVRVELAGGLIALAVGAGLGQVSG